MQAKHSYIVGCTTARLHWLKQNGCNHRSVQNGAVYGGLFGVSIWTPAPHPSNPAQFCQLLRACGKCSRSSSAEICNNWMLTVQTSSGQRIFAFYRATARSSLQSALRSWLKSYRLWQWSIIWRRRDFPVILRRLQRSNRACKLFNIHLYATLCFNYFRWYRRMFLYGSVFELLIC